jgi:hypothetical protein
MNSDTLFSLTPIFSEDWLNIEVMNIKNCTWELLTDESLTFIDKINTPQKYVLKPVFKSLEMLDVFNN